MRKSIMGISIALSLTVASFAAENYSLLDSKDVIAPSYLNSSTVSGPQIGQIIYDNTSAAYKGYVANGTWATMSFPATSFLQYTGNGGETITANTTNLTFANSVYDTDSAWGSSGTVFTAPTTGYYQVVGMWANTTNSACHTFIYVNGSSLLRVGQDAAATDIHPFSGVVRLTAGQSLSIRVAQNVTLSNSATNHHISISQLAH